MSADDQEAAERRVRDAVRRHGRTRAFAEAEDVISAVLAGPGVREARERVEVAETELGMELCVSSRSRTVTTRPWQKVTRTARRALWGQARPLGADLRPAGRARDLGGGTALGPQRRGPADRVGGQRA